MHLKYFKNAIFFGRLRNIPKLFVHDNIIDFENKEIAGFYALKLLLLNSTGSLTFQSSLETHKTQGE